MLNSDFGYPSLAPAKPTYLPSCEIDCHQMTDESRNQPIPGVSPDEQIMLMEEYAYVADLPDLYEDTPKYMFRTQLSWTLTPIGER